jgi:GGDEF domain-containing protein
MLTEELFTQQLDLERRRAERSGRRFVLMLLDASPLIRGGSGSQILPRIVAAMAHSIRETDIKGWHSKSVIGVIFTEIGMADGAVAARAIRNKIAAALYRDLRIESNEVDAIFHIHPEDWEDGSPVAPSGSRACLGPMHETKAKKVSFTLEASFDISGSDAHSAGAEANRE